MNSPILEVVIGIILIYLVLSMICSAIGEVVSLILDSRAKFLWEVVKRILKDPKGTNLAKGIYDHSLIRSLATKDPGVEDTRTTAKRPKPSYIPASFFAVALTDNLGFRSSCAAGSSDTMTGDLQSKLGITAEALKEKQDKEAVNPDTVSAEVKFEQYGVLQPLLASACGDLDKARKNIEVWYDSAMQRATGLYKRRTQVILFFIGILVAFVCNADSVMLSRRLWENPAERAALGAVAKNLVDTAGTPTPDNETGITKEAFEKARSATESLLGWSGPLSVDDPLYDENDPRRFPRSREELLVKIFGIFMTGLAVSFGGPFWFDLLKKVVNPRSVGASPVDPKQQTGRIGGGA